MNDPDPPERFAGHQKRFWPTPHTSSRRRWRPCACRPTWQHRAGHQHRGTQALAAADRALEHPRHAHRQPVAGLARAESSGAQIAFTPCDLARLTIDVVRDSVPARTDKGTDLGYDGAQPGAPGVWSAGQPHAARNWCATWWTTPSTTPRRAMTNPASSPHAYWPTRLDTCCCCRWKTRARHSRGRARTDLPALLPRPGYRCRRLRAWACPSCRKLRASTAPRSWWKTPIQASRPRAFHGAVPRIGRRADANHINGLTTRPVLDRYSVAGRRLAGHRRAQRLDLGAQGAVGRRQAQHVARGIGTLLHHAAVRTPLAARLFRPAARLFGGKTAERQVAPATRWPGGRRECSSRAVRRVSLPAHRRRQSAPCTPSSGPRWSCAPASRSPGQAGHGAAQGGGLFFVEHPACRHSPACGAATTGRQQATMPVPRRVCAAPLGTGARRQWAAFCCPPRAALRGGSAAPGAAAQTGMRGQPHPQQALRPGVVTRVGQQQDEHKNAAWVL